jgi:hypothetical protein
MQYIAMHNILFASKGKKIEPDAFISSKVELASRG